MLFLFYIKQGKDIPNWDNMLVIYVFMLAPIMYM